jgi:hypothetical protein
MRIAAPAPAEPPAGTSAEVPDRSEEKIQTINNPDGPW